MKRVKLGKSNLEVSALAMGTDLIGGKIDRETRSSYSISTETTAEHSSTPQTCIPAGLPGCKGGESESTIGAWMKERGNRDEIVISTKLAFDYPGCEGGLSAVGDPARMREEPEAAADRQDRLVLCAPG